MDKRERALIALKEAQDMEHPKGYVANILELIVKAYTSVDLGGCSHHQSNQGMSNQDKYLCDELQYLIDSIR